MDQIQVRHRVIFICRFSSALREKDFSGEAHRYLVKSTVSGTMDKVVACFRENSRADPREEELGILDPVYPLQLKGHDYADPTVRQ